MNVFPAMWTQLKRVLHRVRTAASDGLGIYLLTMAMLGVVATLVHQAVKPNRNEREALRNLVESEQEPNRPETLPVLGALLVSSDWRCDGDNEAKKLAKQAADLFTTLYVSGKADRQSFSALKALPDESFAAPASNAPERSLFWVPPSLKRFDDPNHLPDIENRSRSLDGLGGLLDQPITGGRIRALYFISVEGVLRLLAEPLPPVTWSPHHTFHGANYVRDALSQNNDPCFPGFAATHPYLDLAGWGVVSTICGRVIEAGGDSAGVFCIDVAHDRESVLAELEKRDALLPMTLVRVEAATGNSVVCGGKGFPSPELCPRALSARGAAAGRAESAAEEWKRLRDEPEGPAKIHKLANVREHTYAAGLLQTGPWYEVVIIDTTPRSTRPSWWLASAIALLVLAGAMVLWARLQRDRRREATVIRGLQVGVIRVNTEDYILGVNDRAREILSDDELPRLGIYKMGRRPGRKRFQDLMGEKAVIVVWNERDGKMEKRDYAWISHIRKQGIAGRYWVWMPQQRWLRIYGSPIVRPTGKMDTFGMLEWETAKSVNKDLLEFKP